MWAVGGWQWFVWEAAVMCLGEVVVCLLPVDDSCLVRAVICLGRRRRCVWQELSICAPVCRTVCRPVSESARELSAIYLLLCLSPLDPRAAGEVLLRTADCTLGLE